MNSRLTTSDMSDFNKIYVPKNAIPIEQLIKRGEPFEFKVVRLSDEDQRPAFPAQRKRVMEYNTGRPFAYCEFDESAFKGSSRLFWNKVVTPLQSAEKSKTHAITVFDKIDRYSRDTASEERGILTKMMRKGAIDLHFPNDGLFVNTDSPAVDHFRLDMGISLGAYFSGATRDNVKRRHEQLVADGKVITRAPLGYYHHNIGYDDKKKRPIKEVRIENTRAPLVKQALEMRAVGMAYAKIAKISRKEGLTSMAGKPITKRSIENICQNPFYAGKLKFKDKEYDHYYPTLIEPWVWKRILEVNRERARFRTKDTEKEHLYRKLLKCAQCGYTVTCDGPKKGNNYYLKCTEQGGKHGAKWVNEKVLNAQIVGLLDTIKIPQNWLPILIKDLEKEFANEQSYYKRQLKRLQAEYDKVDDEIKNIMRQGLRINSRPDLIDELVEELGERQADILEQMKDYSKGNEQFVISATKILQVAAGASALFLSPDVHMSSKQRLLNFILSNPKLDGEKLVFELKTPFDIISGCKKDDSWGE